MDERQKFKDVVEGLGFTDLPLDVLFDHLSSGKVGEIEYKNYCKQYGEDRVAYDLQFNAGRDLAPPYLRSFRATTIKLPRIRHNIYDGINTDVLEAKLQAVTWNSYEKKHDEEQKKGLLEKIVDVLMDDFNVLLHGGKAAEKVAHTLMLKYWSRTPVEDIVNLNIYRRDYEKSHQFLVESDITDVHAKCAYNLLHGRPVLRFIEVENGEFLEHWFYLKEMTTGGFSEKWSGGFDLDKQLRNQLDITDILETNEVSILRPLIERYAHHALCKEEKRPTSSGSLEEWYAYPEVNKAVREITAVENGQKYPALHLLLSLLDGDSPVIERVRNGRPVRIALQVDAARKLVLGLDPTLGKSLNLSEREQQRNKLVSRDVEPQSLPTNKPIIRKIKGRSI